MNKSPATIDQLKRLAAQGLFDPSRDYTKEEVSKIITNEVESGNKPNYALVDEEVFLPLELNYINESINEIHKSIKVIKASQNAASKSDPIEDLYDCEYELINHLLKRQTLILSFKSDCLTKGKELPEDIEEQLKIYGQEFNVHRKSITKELKSGYLAAYKNKLESHITDSLDELSDSKEDVKATKEDIKEQIRQYQVDLGADSQWSRYIKKPPLKKLSDCFYSLNNRNKGWDSGDQDTETIEKKLVVALLKMFPELAKKNAPLNELEGGNSGTGCLVLIIPVFGLLAAGIVITLGSLIQS